MEECAPWIDGYRSISLTATVAFVSGGQHARKDKQFNTGDCELGSDLLLLLRFIFSAILAHLQVELPEVSAFLHADLILVQPRLPWLIFSSYSEDVHPSSFARPPVLVRSPWPQSTRHRTRNIRKRLHSPPRRAAHLNGTHRHRSCPLAFCPPPPSLSPFFFSPHPHRHPPCRLRPPQERLYSATA